MDRLELLVQVELLSLTVELEADLLVELLFDPQNLELAGEEGLQLLERGADRGRLEHGLLVEGRNKQMPGHEVDQPYAVTGFGDQTGELVRDALVQPPVFLEHSGHTAGEGLQLRGPRSQIGLGSERNHFGLERPFRGLENALHVGPAEPLEHDPTSTVGELRHLDGSGDRFRPGRHRRVQRRLDPGLAVRSAAAAGPGRPQPRAGPRWSGSGRSAGAGPCRGRTPGPGAQPAGAVRGARWLRPSGRGC